MFVRLYCILVLVFDTFINMGVDKFAGFMQTYVYYYCNYPKSVTNSIQNILQNNLNSTVC